MSSTLFPNDSVTCVAPWDNWRITSEGKVRHCWCASAQDLRFGEDPDPGADLLTHWHTSPQLQKVRSQIQQGQPVGRCERCYHSTAVNGVGFKTRLFHHYAIQPGKYFRQSLEQNPVWQRMQRLEIEPNGKPAFITIAWDNQCDSRCIMCGPQFSRLVAEDWQDFGFAMQNKYLNANWVAGPDGEAKYQSLLDMVVNNDRLIYLKQNGGEPMLQSQTTRFVEDIVRAGKRDFNFFINTNGTTWNQRVIDAMMTFQWNKLDFAIETMDHTNDYIRFGSSIEQIEQMIQRYRQYDSDNFATVLHCVPQALSAWHLETLIDYCSNNNYALLANPLHGPPQHSLVVLPQDIKQQLIQHWISKYKLDLSKFQTANRIELDMNYLRSEYQQNTKSISLNLQTILVKIIETLLLPEPTDIEQLRHKLVDHVKKFDAKHNLNFCKTFPELADFYHKYQ